MQHPMEQFHQLIHRIITEGVRRPNRTGTDTLYIPGATLAYDLQADGFPAITTKKLAFKSAVGELLGFFRGYDSAAQFRDIGCKVWDQNANETQAWLDSFYRKGVDDIGRAYGKQWTDWKDTRVEPEARARQMIAEKGYTHLGFALSGDWIIQRGINQLEECLHQLITAPTSRRIMLTGWRPDEFDQMALPPCHCDYVLMADPETRTLDLAVFQRSFDMGLAFNTAINALYLSVFARLAGYNARRVNHFICDAHVYVNHVEGMNLMLSREHYPQPQLVISPEVKPITSVDEIPGVFTRIEPHHFHLEGYQHHPAIPLPMAA